jgi:hypothetical protein
VVVALFHGGHMTGAEQALADRIYVMIGMPHCNDIDYAMTPARWARAAVVFACAPLLIWGWRERREAKILLVFVAAVIGVFGLGVVARRLELFGFLKLYPFQLANSLPALFLFLFAPALLGAGATLGRLRWAMRLVGVAAVLWLTYDREVLTFAAERPQWFMSQVSRREFPRPLPNRALYHWIRKNTPRNSVFVTPSLNGFWSYAERAQIASILHPPLDRRLLEWKERLEALNRFEPFRTRGLDMEKELSDSEGALDIEQLVRLRERYGATHYLTGQTRRDLSACFLYSANGYSIYDIRSLTPGGSETR